MTIQPELIYFWNAIRFHSIGPHGYKYYKLNILTQEHCSPTQLQTLADSIIAGKQDVPNVMLLDVNDSSAIYHGPQLYTVLDQTKTFIDSGVTEILGSLLHELYVECTYPDSYPGTRLPLKKQTFNEAIFSKELDRFVIQPIN